MHSPASRWERWWRGLIGQQHIKVIDEMKVSKSGFAAFEIVRSHYEWKRAWPWWRKRSK